MSDVFFLHLLDFFKVNLGRYTMDAMGYNVKIASVAFFLLFLGALKLLGLILHLFETLLLNFLGSIWMFPKIVVPYFKQLRTFTNFKDLRISWMYPENPTWAPDWEIPKISAPL